MCKKSLLSCTAVIAVMLFNTHLNVYAETLEVSGEKKEVSNTTYEIINAKDNGEITGTHLTIVGNKDTNTDIYAVTAEGLGSAITLLQDTTIKGTDFDIRLGLNAKDGAILQMTGGIITVSEIGAFFENSMNDKNKLEGVTISSSKDDHFMDKGINADNKSKVTLENVTVTQANTSIFANDHSEVTILGGAFDGELKGISATEGSAITLTYSKLADNKKGSVQVTSSHGDGLYANGAQSTITMIGGAVTGKNTALLAENGGHIDVTDITLKTGGTGIGAIANDVDSTIELHGNTVINDAVIGLYAANGSTITMTGGTITAFETGAFFNESKSNKNKLENVTITYANTSISDQDKLENVKTSDNELDPGWESELENEKEEFLYTGITAFAGSHLTLKNVTITQAETSISAEDGSQVRILGGAFNGEHVGLYVMNGSFITLANSKEGSVQVTSSNGDGLYADGLFSTIIMMGGTVTAGNRALFAKKGGYIKVTDVALTTMDGNGNGAASTDPYSFIELDGGTTINNAINGLDAENSGVIIMTGGAVTAKSAALITMNGGYIKVTDVALTTMEGNGYGAASTDPESLIELHGKTTINNALIGLYTENSGTIAMAGGTVTGKSAAVLTKSGGHIKVTDVALTTMDGNGYGAATSDPDSLIELHGKTTINNAFIGLYTENSGTITMAGGTVAATNMALLAKSGGHIKLTDVALTTMDGNGYGAATSDPESLIELYGKTTINNIFIGLNAENSGAITMTGGAVTATNVAVLAKSGGHIKVTDVALTTTNGNYGAAATDPKSLIELYGKTTINNAVTGLEAENSGTIIMTGGTVTAKTMALFAMNGGHIKVTDVALTTMDGNGYGTAASNPYSLIELHGNTAISNTFIGLYAENGGTIKMTGGTVAAKGSAFVLKNSGYIDVTNVSATAENSGITFDKSEDDNALEINLTNTKIRTENSIGINADQSIGIANLKNSEISADILLAAKASTKENNFAFTLNANHSVLKGRAKIAENRTARFDLTNKTTWILKTSTKETDDDGKLLAIAQRSRSDISVLNLNDSSIVFNGPVEDHYHTLHIGSGKPDTKAVYNASSEAEIHFNAIWSDGVAIDAQKTDRLLIHGDVAGTTTVYVKVSGDKENVENVSASSNIGGLSLIQVSGEAKEDSFKLKNGYTTIGGTPYKYTLTAYGPVSSYGKANANQNLFDEKDKDFWDFRLQPEFLDPNSKVRTVVPQMASYLVMPNALFYAGLADMAKQNALLANMRTTVFGEQNNLKNNFFLSTYGGTGTLSSKRGPLKYGYGTDIRYAALQAGVTLAAIEGQSTTTHLGLLGTYGQLSFTPKEMQDASKSTLDKWSLTAYGSVQHDSGFYIDTLLSYGIIKGDITNAIIGKTAKLNNVKMLSISTTVGKQFSIGMEGVTFEPQIQLAYQHLMFDTIEDADNLKIDMKNPSQWLIRVGGRLTKTIMTTENGPAISFYGKVNLIKTFGDKGKVQISKNFDLDPMGTAIEGGVGINAQLSHNFSLYGDVSYQQKLQKTGISGASFSGGIRYQF
ncbi:autotransporter outer membrane beta-barrel domain-containing protein [Bartonella sp. AS69XJJH]|uniref:autotransporter outer membrane beta-barrel domain-containing protein n=1 Tax=Bartonella sp. AS69XJJH TaxID=3243508 RepID=UPI0035CEA932